MIWVEGRGRGNHRISENISSNTESRWHGEPVNSLVTHAEKDDFVRNRRLFCLVEIRKGELCILVTLAG